MTENPSHEVVPLPVLKSSSIEDTLSGFPDQMGQNTHLGRRVEHTVTMVAAEIRGWDEVASRFDPDRTRELLDETVVRVLEVLESLGARDISIDGSESTPAVEASFDDDNHALRAVVAAESAREVVSKPLHPSADERFRACIGVSTGTVTDTRVHGSGIAFQATGTLKMFAVRLQEFAGPDQVFLSETTYRSTPTHLDVVPIGEVRTNSDGETEQAFALRGLLLDEPGY